VRAVAEFPPTRCSAVSTRGWQQLDIEDFRREYVHGGLQHKDLLPDPLAQFESWLAQSVAAGISDPTAMVVATADSEGRPSQRMVLLKDFGPSGFVFYTNLESRKAREMADNSQVCLHFPWNMLDRQVIVQGTAQRLSTMEVARYFLSRPRESQLVAWASAQSRTITARQVVEQKVAEMTQKFRHGEIPLPGFWGGYRIIPREIEFWQGGAHRLHDRFRYSHNSGSDWTIERLAP
jgi:pyridoxamine 5'-phosphate oxidase